MLERFLLAAASGDETARKVVNDLPMGMSELAAICRHLGVYVWRTDSRISFASSTYPRTIDGSLWLHVQTKAKEGDYYAERIVSYIVWCRIKNPDIVIDEGFT